MFPSWPIYTDHIYIRAALTRRIRAAITINVSLRHRDIANGRRRHVSKDYPRSMVNRSLSCAMISLAHHYNLRKPHTAAGSRSFGRYLSNPLLKVIIPTSMTIMYVCCRPWRCVIFIIAKLHFIFRARLQRLDASSSVAINLAMFVATTSGEINLELTNSGDYSEAVSGVLIQRTAVSAGEYILLPSTYIANFETGFQILFYSSIGGVETSWLRH